MKLTSQMPSSTSRGVERKWDLEIVDNPSGISITD
jgi:hypothetical protein